MAQNFVITTAGMAAASVAGASGPKIDIVAFKLGSGSGYTPAAGDTGLTGSTVFTGVPLSVTPHNGDTTDVLVQLGANDGPFSFGEIGLYMPGDILFAKMAYPALQAKVSDAINGVGSTWNIHALLKLADAPALFNFTLSNNVTVPIVAGAAVLGPDAMGANINAIFALDLNGATPLSESPILLKRKSATEWVPEDYRDVGNITLSSVTGVNIASPVFNANTILKNNGGQSCQYLIVNPVGGQLVPVFSASPTAGTATLTRAAAWLNTTDTYKLYAYYPPELAPIESPHFLGTPTKEAPGSVFLTADVGYNGYPLRTPGAGAYTVTRADRGYAIVPSTPDPLTFVGGSFVAGDTFVIINESLSLAQPVSSSGTFGWRINGSAMGGGTFNIPPATMAVVVFATSNMAWVSYTETNGGITGSLGAAGWTTLPNGLILQWDMVVNAGTVISSPITFPIPFPVACFGLQHTYYTGATGDKAGNDNNDTFANLTRFGCDLRMEGTLATHVFYLAVGH